MTSYATDSAYGKGEIRDGTLGVGSHTCLIRVIAARRRR
jgi:hypothetical protein